MELHFQLVKDEPIFRGLARVIRLEGPGLVGLTFEKLGLADRERLRRFIDAHLPILRERWARLQTLLLHRSASIRPQFVSRSNNLNGASCKEFDLLSYVGYSTVCGQH